MKILVVHPLRLIADALGCVLSTEPGFEVVGTCYDKDTAIEKAKTFRPDTIVVGGVFPEFEIAKFAAALKEQLGNPGVIVVSQAPKSTELIAVLDAGVEGYVTYDCGKTDLVEAILKIGHGEVVLRGIERTALGTRQNGHDEKGGRRMPVEALTPREREVLDLLSEGFSNKQIAETLYVSEHTVRTHIQNLRTKLNVRSKFEAAMWAMKSGAGPVSRIRF